MNHVSPVNMCKKKHQQEQSTGKIFTQPFLACVPMKAVALAAIHILRDLPWLIIHDETYISCNYPSSHKNL